jgi:transaldolase / glucose-6-phosphate isomerase
VNENPLRQLEALGQSIWLDYIRRNLVTSGELRHLIEEDGLRGMTSNPSIFESAIAGSHDYDEDIRALALEGKNVQAIYEALSQRDVQSAADEFRNLYDKNDGKDGYVSLEVNPHLAHDTPGTIAEARRLWGMLQRPNVFIKVPATEEGLPAIQQLVSEGINVNVTLLFGLPRYRRVAEAYIAGIEARAAKGKPITHVASVASFFLSRIDVLADPQLDKLIAKGGPKAPLAQKLHGMVAIASAKMAYQIYKEIFRSDRFRKLAGKGARVQRLLWASTSTKNPAYSDVKYIDTLIGPDTVNTMPLETLDAYRDHGDPKLRLEKDLDEARGVLEQLPELGISIDKLTQQLENEGVEKFNKPFDKLMETLRKACAAVQHERVDRQQLSLGEFQSPVNERIDELKNHDFSQKLWRKDASLWKRDAEAQREIRNSLGWLHVAEKMEETLGVLSEFATEVQAAGFRHVVHMGMGGSSLAPLVFERAFKPAARALALTVLDTTDPATIRRVERKVPLRDTLFIVASKSGTTAEPLAFGQYFYGKVREQKGGQAGENFVAITDPDTPLVTLAKQRGFRRTFLNFADIGGRYSALSYFGMAPAVLMGVDVGELLIRALRMARACSSCVPVRENPGVTLGATMGELARRKRDKVTFLVPDQILTLSMWLEQLLAESTGKEGKGLLPVAGEPIGDPGVYGNDRLFVHLRVAGAIDRELERGVAALREAGQPVVTLQMDDLLDLGQEFFRWEIATATAGAVLGINAFDQPNVQESKDNTNRLLRLVRDQGRLPEDRAALREGFLTFYGERAAATIAETLAQFFGQAHPGDYVALQAYLPETVETEQVLRAIRVSLRDRLHLATTSGYGPRFLHSTGQFHKGGPNSGLFLQLTAADKEDVPIPGEPYSFGVFKQAQAQGDLEALRKHGRRVMRIHMSDLTRGLPALEEAMLTALNAEAPRRKG